MNLFPERDDHRGRWLLAAAVLASLVIHFGVGPVVRWWWPRIIVPALARVMPRPSPTPEIVALSDAITIEKRTVPRPTRRTQPQRRPAPQPRRVAQQPPSALPVPTLPPLPTAPPTARVSAAPTAEPTFRAQSGTIHHPQAAPSAAPVHRTVTSAVAPSSRNGFSAQQLAALDAQFSKTIAQAQRSLTDVPPQRRPPARMPNQMRYERIMAGTPEMFLSAQGDCHPIQEGQRGTIDYYYLSCLIRYSDGYFEEVSFLWPHVFSRRNDPIDMSRRDGVRHPFPMQAPPAGFVLPPNFALSRAVCSFYQARCAEIIARERANGNQPATLGQ